MKTKKNEIKKELKLTKLSNEAMKVIKAGVDPLTSCTCGSCDSSCDNIGAYAQHQQTNAFHNLYGGY